MGCKEKLYGTMGFAGVVGIAVGIVVLCVGIIAGVLMIISGSKALSDRKEILL